MVFNDSDFPLEAKAVVERCLLQSNLHYIIVTSNALPLFRWLFVLCRMSNSNKGDNLLASIFIRPYTLLLSSNDTE